MPAWSVLRKLGLLAALCCGSAHAVEEGAAGKDEPVEVSVCRIIESAAQTRDLPVELLTRLIWQESRFRPDVVSPAGAQGIAQFMPKTADARGVVNPFDPEEAIPKAADLLVELKQRLGNLGLATAAYNAGAARVARWLAGRGPLPSETRAYVQIITRRPVEDWSAATATAAPPDAAIPPAQSCSQMVADIRRLEPADFFGSALLAPWGVQLAAGFSKPAALAAYARVRNSYSAILGDIEPMVIGGRLRSRGFSSFYRVRAPAPSRAAAGALCEKILRAGGACVVLRS